VLPSGGGAGALLVSLFNVKWRCSAQAGGVEGSSFASSRWPCLQGVCTYILELRGNPGIEPLGATSQMWSTLLSLCSVCKEPLCPGYRVPQSCFCRRQGSLCEPFCLDLALEHFAVVCLPGTSCISPNILCSFKYPAVSRHLPNFSISSTRWRRPCFSSGSLPCRWRKRAPYQKSYSRTSQPACTSSYPSLPQHINTPV
jgi:hypothetical protein